MDKYASWKVRMLLMKDGWYLFQCSDKYHQFKHPNKKGRISIKRGDMDIPPKTLKIISQQTDFVFK